MNGHTLLTPKTCKHEYYSGPAGGCYVCDGGLSICATCGAAESELDEPCKKPQESQLQRRQIEMGRSSEAYVADMERRLLNGDFDNLVDPYDYHIACEALGKIALGTVESPRALATEALSQIGIDPRVQPIDPELFLNHTYATDTEYRRHIEATTRPSKESV